MRKTLILQARPEDAAADGEFAAILRAGRIVAGDVERVRLERDPVPKPADLANYAGIILGGGPGCVTDARESKDPDEARIEDALLSLMPTITGGDLPFMGCCLGIGILGHHLGPFVSKDRFSEPVGTADCSLTPAAQTDPLMQGIDSEFTAFVGHKEALQALPDGCTHIVSSPSCPFQMIRHGENVYATQFHPEADAQEFELRIRIYRDRGYFAPEDADRLIAVCRAATVDQPARILENFINRYAR